MQDAYSLRCAPQVAGAARDTLAHASEVAKRELAAAIDNPVVTLDGRIESNGNFHGAPVGYVLDFLAIAAADLASMSERRTDRFLDTSRSHGLPPFLADDPGVDSGLMIAQYTQAGLVSELKRLAAPASVDSIPSSAMQEDHVSMGWSAGRKLRRAIDGLSQVLAIELLTAARGIQLRAPLEPGPRDRERSSTRLERVPAPTASSPPRSRRPLNSSSPAAPSAPPNRSLESWHDKTLELECLGWTQEAALRMLHNNLHPDVAEHPEELIVYGGTGKAARDHASLHAIERTLKTLKDDETLLIQSGKPVGVLQTHEWAPRVLLANSNLVGDWATWDEFRRLDALGLTMYGQMTAGSWIYIGTQGILQGTYETFSAVANKRFGGSLEGTITLTGGLGGMGGAQPLAVTMNGGVAICVDVDQSRIARRVDSGYLDVEAISLDHALDLATKATGPLSIGLLGNCADVFPELLRRGAPIDIVTDQTSAHDPLAYLPSGVAFENWAEARKQPGFIDKARESMARHVEAMVGFMDAGAEVFDYGNSIRAEALLGGYERAFDFPGFVPAYIRPLFCEGKGPFRWAALSGEASDIAATDQAVLDLFPENESLSRWIRLAQEKVQFQGLPARICWLGAGERDRAGLAFNDLVASGSVAAPIVIGRDHLDCRLRRLALPRDRSDARRQRRDRRLAAAERDGQRRLRRVLGLDPPRRRRRHRPLDSRRAGDRRRRHAAGRPEARARAEQRPRHGRDPPRRRRLRARRGGRRGEGHPRADDGGRVTAGTYFADFAWLGGDAVDRDVAIEVVDGRIVVRARGRRARRHAPQAASRFPGSRTRTRTPSSARSEGARSAATGRSGRGGRTCTRSPRRSRRTAPTSSPRARTPRCAGRGSRRSASSTTSITARR